MEMLDGMTEKELLNKYVKAFVHTIYRNGPVEDIHVYNISDSEMKQINKHMVNRFGYVFAHTLFGFSKTREEKNAVVDMIIELYISHIVDEDREYVLKFDEEDEATKFALGMFYFQEINSPLNALFGEGRITEKHLRNIYMYMIRRLILIVKGHIFLEKSEEISELFGELLWHEKYKFGDDWDDIEPIDIEKLMKSML